MNSCRIALSLNRESSRETQHMKIKHVDFETFVVDSIQWILLFLLSLHATATFCLLFVSTLHFHLLFANVVNATQPESTSFYCSALDYMAVVRRSLQKKVYLSKSRKSDNGRVERANRFLLASTFSNARQRRVWSASSCRSCTYIDRFLWKYYWLLIFEGISIMSFINSIK